MDSEDLISLGGHPALDLLNSFASLLRETFELIGDGSSYLTWLMRTGRVDADDAAVIAARFTAPHLDEAAAEARALREWLRPIVAAWAGDAEGATGAAALPAHARSHLNDILATDCRHVQLDELADGSFVLGSHRQWNHPRQLLIPPAEAAAQLFAYGDHRLVRICEGPSCMLWFYDHTKAHRRRWCSMAVCGNRAKARSHRDRSRELPTSSSDAECRRRRYSAGVCRRNPAVGPCCFLVGGGVLC